MDRHSLLQEFPEYQEKIHQLKIENNHFRKIFDGYHKLEHDIHRIKSGAEVTSDEELNKLKIQLLHHKDELFEMLKS